MQFSFSPVPIKKNNVNKFDTGCFMSNLKLLLRLRTRSLRNDCETIRKKFIYFLRRISRRAYAFIICGQVNKCELVILSSLVRVACTAWIRFSRLCVSLSLSPSIFIIVTIVAHFFFFWSTAARQHTHDVKWNFFYMLFQTHMGEHFFFFFSPARFFLFQLLPPSFSFFFACSFVSLAHYYRKRADALPRGVIAANWNSQQYRSVSCVRMRGSCQMCQALSSLLLPASLTISETESMCFSTRSYLP